jgi:nucleotidyltransferase/DNA polymerase involved in DNA repair
MKAQHLAEGVLPSAVDLPACSTILILLVYSTMPRIGCLRIPHFPAWTLHYSHSPHGPQHGSDAIVVVQSGCVLAASRTARRRGVQAGMAREQAMRLAPTARYEPRDVALEEATWDDVLGRLYETTPRIDAPRHGLAYFEPFDKSESFGGEDAATRSATAQLLDAIQVQGAVAPARSFARLAAFRAHPGSMIDLTAADVNSFLASFQTTWLPQVSAVPEDVADRLVLFGYRTLGELAHLSKKHLRAQFGDAGTRIDRLLRPDEGSRVAMMKPPPSVRRGHTFERPVREPASLRPVVQRLVTRCTEQLGDRYCQRVEIRFIQRSGEEHITSRVLRGLTQKEDILRKQAVTLLRQLLRADRQVDTVEVALAALGRPMAEQGSLFAERPQVKAAIDAVRRRYPEALLRAVTAPHAVFDEQRFAMIPVGET